MKTQQQSKILKTENEYRTLVGCYSCVDPLVMIFPIGIEEQIIIESLTPTIVNNVKTGKTDKYYQIKSIDAKSDLYGTRFWVHADNLRL